MEWQYYYCRISSKHFYVCVHLHFNPSSSTSFQLHNYSFYFTNSPIFFFSLHPVLNFHRQDAEQQLGNFWRAASGLPEVGTSF